MLRRSHLHSIQLRSATFATQRSRRHNAHRTQVQGRTSAPIQTTRQNHDQNHAKPSLVRLQISECKMALSRERRANMRIGGDPDGASTAQTSTTPSPSNSGPSCATSKWRKKWVHQSPRRRGLHHSLPHPEAASSSTDKRPEQPKRGRPRKVCPPDVDCPRCWCLERRIPYGGSHTWIGTCKGKRRSAAQAAS